MATTGLLEKLKEKKYNVKDWLVEDVIRLFGITVCLRDYPSKNKIKIYKLLKKDDDNRNNEIKMDLNPIYPKIVSDGQLQKIYKKRKKECEKRLWKYLEKKEKALTCIEELSWITEKNNSNDDLVVNLFKVAREQLDILKADANDGIELAKLQLKGRYNSFEDFKRYVEEEREKEIKWLDRQKEETKKKELYNNAEIYKKLLDMIYK